MNSIPLKTCIYCKRALPHSEFYRKSSSSDGFQSRCKDCDAEKSGRVREKEDTAPLGFKTCTKCGTVLPATTEFFNKHKLCKYGVTAECKSCIHEWHRLHNKNPEVKKRVSSASKRHYEAHKEERREQYLENMKNPEWVKEKNARSRKYYASDEYRAKERARNATPQRKRYHQNYTRKYRKTPRGRDVMRASTAKRRALKLQSGGTYNAKDVSIQLRIQKGLCWWCGKPVGDKYHADHRIALDRGGSNDARNICISCVYCNLSKGNKLPHEWSGRLL